MNPVNVSLVTTAWCVFRWRIPPPRMGVATNVLNKQLWTTENGLSSSLGIEACYGMVERASNLDEFYRTENKLKVARGCMLF